MSSIDISYLNTNLIPVDSDSTIDQAVVELYPYHPDERIDWYFLVELIGDNFSVVAITDLLEEIAQRGEDLLGMKLSDVPGLLLPTTTLERINQGIGEARKIMRRSPKQRVLVLDGGDAVGVLAEPKLGGEFQDYMTTLIREPEMAMVGGFEEEQEPTSRYTNVCLTRDEGQEVVSGKTSLAANTEYHLRLNIGPHSKESVVKKPVDFPNDMLPSSESGHWLHVVAVSNDFDVSPKRHNIFLPTVGPSWVCDCTPGEEHECSKEERQDYLFIQVKSPSKMKTATLRLSIYYENNLVQSQLLSAEILDAEGKGGYSSEIDYTLSAALSDVAILAPRALNIMTNQNLDSTHTLVIKNGSEDVLSFNFSEAQIKDALRRMRSTMYGIHIRIHDEEKINRFDDNNSKEQKSFVEDVRSLARVGWLLWTSLFTNNPDQGEELLSFLKGEDGTIQVSRVSNKLFVFPWAFVYDTYVDSDVTKHELCQLLDEWDQERANLTDYPSQCPYESNHKKNTICPYGFWGDEPCN